MNLNDLNNVTLNAKDSGAINYVKARFAIDNPDAGFANRAERRAAKMQVVSFLNGTVQHPEPTSYHPKPHPIVTFPDNTKAKF